MLPFPLPSYPSTIRANPSLNVTVVDNSSDWWSLYSSLLTDYFAVTVIIEAVLMISIFAGNILVGVVVLRSPHLRTYTNMFLLSLSASDALSGVSIIVIVLTILKPTVTMYIPACKLRYAMLMSCWMASIHSLLAITFDRLVAVVHPLYYQMLMTKIRVFIVLCGIWTYSIGVGAAVFVLNEPPTLNESVCDLLINISRDYLLYCASNFVLVVLAILFCYWRIFLVARNQARRSPPGFPSSYFHSPRKSWSVLKDRKYVRTLAMVIGVLLICWVPLVIILLLELTRGISHSLQTARIIASFFCQFNSFINPIVYTWRNSEFSSALSKICSGHKVQPAQSLTVSTILSPRSST
ncbi:adenosine receptor A2b-like [Limulus polyphemus]|uniref:Adenosine receptor A2b-like n=1 Tax=Limulus polyphemus TaxID=6850 RepID=A0ABM1S3X8_LIMPO|nr:adenosine receptor A2b-like [Limulus polyphemus]